MTGGLLQLFTVPPPEYSQETGAPYGAGHCNFTPESRIAVIELPEALPPGVDTPEDLERVRALLLR